MKIGYTFSYLGFAAIVTRVWGESTADIVYWNNYDRVWVEAYSVYVESP